MSTPSNATVYAVYGQAQNISAVIKSATTGNPLTGGLSGLTAYVSLDDAAFALTTSFAGGSAPSERGASGWVSLDLTPAMMTARKIDVEIRATNTNAVYATVSVVTVDLTPETVRFDAETVMRVERLWLNLHSHLFNAKTLNIGGSLTISNRNGTPFASGGVVNATTQGVINKLV